MADPNFNAPITNPFGLTDVGSYAAPTFADIDGDGDLDAFVGNDDGNTVFYRNTGTTAAPTFTFEAAQPFGLTNLVASAKPTFADIDADGDLDAFVGNSGGNTLFYRNIGTQTAPTFTFEASNPFGLTDVGTFAAPTLADIDADGDLDAFVGNYNGNTLFYRNTGTTAAPTFTLEATNPFGLTDVGFLAVPTFADIDGDGDLDAFVGNTDGDTLFYRNSGTATAPAFTLEATNPFGLTNVGSSAAPTFADIDGDGDLDAFVGNSDGNTGFFENTATNTPVNNPPTANNDSATTAKNTAVTISASTLLANDTDPDSNPLSITGVSNATNGTAVLNNNGTTGNTADDFIVFTPTTGFSGNGSFDYTLSDGSLTDIGNVTVAVGTNLFGGNGDDLLNGTAGNDNLTGGTGQDTLNGSAGNDTLNGGNGADKLTGGTGNDILTGGSASDTFIFAASHGTDTITDFKNGVDYIGLSGGLTFGQLSFSGSNIIVTSTNEILATLTGINTATLTAADFLTV